MTTPLVLLGLIAFAGVLLARRGNRRVQRLMKQPARRYLPQAISMLVLTAQITELIRVVQHLSIVTVSAALMLFVIVAADKQGTEGRQL